MRTLRTLNEELISPGRSRGYTRVDAQMGTDRRTCSLDSSPLCAHAVDTRGRDVEPRIAR